MTLNNIAIKFAYSTIPHLAKGLIQAIFVNGKSKCRTKVHTPRQVRKKVDTRRITVDQALYTKEYRDANEGTWLEHTAHLNELFGLDKSPSYYFRVWKNPLNELKLKIEED